MAATQRRVWRENLMIHTSSKGAILWSEKPGFTVRVKLLDYNGEPELVQGGTFKLEDEKERIYELHPDKDGIVFLLMDHNERVRFEPVLGNQFEPFVCAGPLDVNLDGQVDESDLTAFKEKPYDWDLNGSDEPVGQGDRSDLESFEAAYLSVMNPSGFAAMMRKLKLKQFVGSRRGNIEKLVRNRR